MLTVGSALLLLASSRRSLQPSFASFRPRYQNEGVGLVRAPIFRSRHFSAARLVLALLMCLCDPTLEEAVYLVLSYRHGSQQ